MLVPLTTVESVASSVDPCGLFGHFLLRNFVIDHSGVDLVGSVRSVLNWFEEVIELNRVLASLRPISGRWLEVGLTFGQRYNALLFSLVLDSVGDDRCGRVAGVLFGLRLFTGRL